MRRFALRVALAPLATMSLCTCIAPALAQGAASGGVQAPSLALAGGAEYGVSTASSERPVLSQLSFPTAANIGRPPRMKLRIDEAGVATVDAQV